MKARKWVPEAISVFLGLFFLLSGIGKLLDVEAFRGTLLSYGVPESLSFAAAILPPLEILLALLLFFKRRSRALAWISFGLLSLFTVAFVYAHFAKGVEDCGCFGRILVLQTSPTVSIIRNLILLALAFYLARATWQRTFDLARWQWVTLAVTAAVTCLLSGISSVKPLYLPENPLLKHEVNETVLNDLVHVSPDSIYLIFAYNASCHFCWDATENVKAYKRDGVVDAILGLTYSDEGGLMVFEETFLPNFSTKIIDKEVFDQIATETPTVLYIQDGIIRDVQVKTVMSPARFQEEGLHGAFE